MLVVLLLVLFTIGLFLKPILEESRKNIIEINNGLIKTVNNYKVE